MSRPSERPLACRSLAWLLGTTALAGMILLPRSASAAADDWVGATSSNWYTAGNWSTAVPTGADAVTIATISPNTTLINGGTATTGSLHIGAGGGAGTLAIQNAGHLTSNSGTFSFDLSFDPNSIGTVTVNGANSAWTMTHDLVVGYAGTGTMTVSAGGGVSNDGGRIGDTATGNGTVTVTGAGSQWIINSELDVGTYGTGKLIVSASGLVTAMNSYVAFHSGSTGDVTVSGAGSEWHNVSSLFVGGAGAGTLTINSGAHVDNDIGAVIGSSNPGVGTVTVTGSGSRLTAPILVVGDSGHGTLNILAGGVVDAVTVNIGANALSQGAVTVDGSGSLWTVASGLAIGNIGAGSLTISNNGVVSSTSGSAFLAFAPGSSGTLNIGAAPGSAAVAPGSLNAISVQFGAGTGAINFNHTAASYVFAAAISGPGTVNQISGNTSLTATSTYYGATTVDGGTLSVNGSIAGSTVTVNAAGTLGGNGIVGNTIINGGALAPGNSIGTLTVQGNLSMTAASTYRVEVSPASADRTDVSGTATLGGATVAANFAAGSYVAKQYTILAANGGVSGTFGALASTNLPSGFKSSLSYDAKNVYLDLALSLSPNGGAQSSVNHQNVAGMLTTYFNTNGSIQAVFGALSPAGLTQASGESATGAQQTTFDAMGQFTNLLLDPFIGNRDDAGAPAARASQYAGDGAGTPAAGPHSAAERDAYAAVYRKAPADGLAQRWSLWAAGYGGSQTTDGNAAVGSNAATGRIFGIAEGADYRLSPDTLVGFALGGGGTSFSLANGLGGGRSDLFQAGAFARHGMGNAYVAGALAYGWQNVTTDRTLTIAGIDQLNARYIANAFSARVEGGYRLVTQWIGLTPYAAGQLATLALPAYAEQTLSGANTFALNYTSKEVTAWRSELGLRTDKSWALTDAILTLRGRAAWAHNFSTDRSIAATFQTLAGTSFVVNGAAPAHDAALATVSAETKWLNGFSLATTFEGEFSGVTRSYAGKGVARYAW